jgi:DNA-binding NarL/FixJ family response regulator
VYAALASGASGFLLKHVSPEYLITAIRLVRTGDALLARRSPQLVLSEATVKTHVARILAKLQLRDRVQAVVLAYGTGLVTPAGQPAREPDTLTAQIADPGR